jgi:hypothetical protein
MKQMNFYLQSGLIALGAFTAIMILFDNGFLVAFMILQFFVGVIQYILSLVWSVTSNFSNSLLNLHFIGATVYLASMFAFSGKLYGDLGMVLFTVVPWMYALLFWFISYRESREEVHHA